MANSNKGSRNASSGGRAEAAGGNYETLVASWYSVRLLAGEAGEPPADLPSNVRLLSILCQTEAPVDDVLIETDAKGFLFIQAKRSIDLALLSRHRLHQCWMSSSGSKKNAKMHRRVTSGRVPSITALIVWS